MHPQQRRYGQRAGGIAPKRPAPDLFPQNDDDERSGEKGGDVGASFDTP